MSTNHKPSDDADEASLAWLLSSAGSAPEMRAEFARALSTKLDAQFAAIDSVLVDEVAGAAGTKYFTIANGHFTVNGQANGQATNGHVGHGQANGHATNGHAKNGHAINGQATNGQVSLSVADAPAAAAALAAVKARRSLRLRKWSVGVAAAASLLVATAVWADPPAWVVGIRSAVIRAIVNTIERYTIGSGSVNEDGGGARALDVPVQVAPEVGPPSESLAVAENVPTVEAPAAEQLASATAASPLPVQTPPVVPTPPALEKPQWSPPEVALEEGELTERINEQLSELWATQRIHPVGPAGDAEFMRRVYLDLTGRVPSVGEARDFLADQSPDRREELVDRLLAHRDHATHFAAVWRRILLPDDVDLARYGGSADFEEWLAEKFAANMPYDQIVQELLLAEGRVSESGPLLFYAAVRLNPEELAARTSRAFLGVRMECAQCHDHPFDDAVSQQDFWSFAAFFARISRPRGKMEMTSPVLQVRDNAFGDVMIPESDEVVPPRLPGSRLPGSVMELAEEAEGSSRREQLVAWLTDRHNRHFAQATVNRVWAHLFGRGLVEPVDDMRPANPAISPELLETLSGDFAASGFDLRRLCRALVLTDAYQLASGAEENDPSRTLTFAQMNIKSFTAEQLYDCITIATGRASLAAPVGIGAFDQPGLVRSSDMNRQQFIEQFRTQPGQVTDYQAGIPQALTMMHGGLIHNATDVAASGLLKSLAAPFFSDSQRLDTLYLATLSRYPEAEEREIVAKEIAAAQTPHERQQVLGDVLWALVNSAEFTLNH